MHKETAAGPRSPPLYYEKSCHRVKNVQEDSIKVGREDLDVSLFPINKIYLLYVRNSPSAFVRTIKQLMGGSFSIPYCDSSRVRPELLRYIAAPFWGALHTADCS